jgi:hypothetical protein
MVPIQKVALSDCAILSTKSLSILLTFVGGFKGTSARVRTLLISSRERSPKHMSVSLLGRVSVFAFEDSFELDSVWLMVSIEGFVVRLTLGNCQ